MPTAVLHRFSRRMRVGGRSRAIVLSSFEAVVVGGMFAATEFWLLPLLQLRLGAPPFVVGMLVTLPLLGMAVVGPVVGAIIEHLGGNRRAIIATSLGQCACLAALALPLHMPHESWASPLALTLGVGIGVLGAIGGPAWVGLMAVLVPPRLQGRFTANRLRLFLVAKLCVALGFAGLMEVFPAALSPWGFQIIFLVAIAARLVSTLLNSRLPDAHAVPRKGGFFVPRLPVERLAEFGQFLRTIHRSDFGRWTLAWALLHFGVAIAGPYFVPYMLGQGPAGLGMGESPLAYLLLLQVAQATRLVVLPAVGRMVDRFGGSRVLRTSMTGIALVPVLWSLSPSYGVLVFAEFLSGVSWCMAECAASVLLFNCDNDPRQRARLIAYHQSVIGIAFVVGGTIGGALLAVLPLMDGSAYRSLFLASVLLRLPACALAIFFLPRLHLWDRKVRRELWSVIVGTNAALTGHRGLLRFLRRPEG